MARRFASSRRARASSRRRSGVEAVHLARPAGTALQRQPAPGGQAEPESLFTIFVAEDAKKTDVRFARDQGRKDAARIRKAGTFSTEERQLVRAKLRFFEGDAWTAYSDTIRPALVEATQEEIEMEGDAPGRRGRADEEARRADESAEVPPGAAHLHRQRDQGGQLLHRRAGDHPLPGRHEVRAGTRAQVDEAAGRRGRLPDARRGDPAVRVAVRGIRLHQRARAGAGAADDAVRRAHEDLRPRRRLLHREGNRARRSVPDQHADRAQPLPNPARLAPALAGGVRGAGRVPRREGHGDRRDVCRPGRPAR